MCLLSIISFFGLPHFTNGPYTSFIYVLFGPLCGMQDLFPNQGSNLCPLHWKQRVLTMGPPGKAPVCMEICFYLGLYTLPHI